MAGLGDILGKAKPVETTATETVVEETVNETTTTTENVAVEETETPKPIDWLGGLNANFKTEFKTPEEVSKHFERSKKIDEYEPKIKEFETKEKQYKEQLEALSSLNNDPLRFFTSTESFVAEQLRKQYPDKSPYILQEIVGKDNKGMADVEVLVKNKLLDTPDLIGGEAGARELVYSELGIDGDTPETEWTNLTRNKIKTQAKDIRKTWDELKTKVEVPKVQSPEELLSLKESKRVERLTQAKPLIDEYSKFDQFTEEIEEGKVFTFTTPDEYKRTLPDMITAALEAGIEPTAENMAVLHEQKEALMLRRNFKQIYKIIEADVETRMKAEEDKRNGNIKPTNTTKATEGEAERAKFSNEHGMGKLLNKK